MGIEQPAEVFPPGEHLKEELEARGWTQADLAEILGRPPRLVSELVTGKRSITPETAQGLGEALGNSPEYWMNLESLYRLAQSRTIEGAVSKRAKIYGQFPVKEMVKRGWLKPSSSLVTIENRLLEFFEMRTLEDVVRIPHAAKKTAYEKISSLQLAWLQRARQLAPSLIIGNYSPAGLEGLLQSLRRCARNPEDLGKVPKLLGDAGIRFLAIEALPGSKIDAACLWFDDQPLLLFSLRYDRHDIFWHALFHELDHVAHDEGRDEPIIDQDMMGKCSAGIEIEQRANAAAANLLIPQTELTRFMTRAGPYVPGHLIIEFAEKLAIHPGIVVGQLQHHGIIAWSSMNSFKSRVREFLVPHAMSDGFGRVSR